MTIIGSGQPGVDGGQPGGTPAPTGTPAPAAPTGEPQGTPAPTAQPAPTGTPAPVAAPAPAPTGTPAPAPSLYDQVKTANIKDVLPEQYRDNPYLSRVNDIDTLAKNYVESQQFISQSVRLPGENATEQERADFYKKIGRPDSPDGYSLNLKEEYKTAGIQLDNNMANWYKDVALKANLTKEQADVLFNQYVDSQVKSSQEIQALSQEQANRTMDALKGEWRSKYQDNINLINSRLDNFFPKDVQEVLKSKGLFADQGFIKAMLGLTKNITGDNLFVEGGNADGYKSDLQKLEAKRSELMRAPDRRSRQSEEYDLNKQILELKTKLNQSGER